MRRIIVEQLGTQYDPDTVIMEPELQGNQEHVSTLTSLPGRDVDQVKSGCLVQVGNGIMIELEAVGLQFEPYRWRPCGVTWDSSRTVVVIKLRRTSALHTV